jgi:chromosome segregation ATPase
MIPAAINLTWIEVSILLLVALILMAAVRFFIISRRSLQQVLQPQRKQSAPSTQKEPYSAEGREKQLVLLQERLAGLKQKTFAPAEPEKLSLKGEHTKDDLIQSLKGTISQQQKLLNGFLKQIDELEDSGKMELEAENEELKLELEGMEKMLSSRDAEIERLQQQATIALSMSTRIDEVVQEFEHLQKRMMELEEQATKASILAMELEEAREGYDLVRMDLIKKQERLEDVIAENQNLRQQMAETEDKLVEANRQRQQLQKKTQFLQDMNEDFHSMSESNKKLQTELRRIGELESMLNMIAEERDQLLRKQYK